jgi:hypothetical protein
MRRIVGASVFVVAALAAQAGAQTFTAVWEASSGLFPESSPCPAFVRTNSAVPEQPVLSATELTLSTSEVAEDMFYMQDLTLSPDPLVVEARVRFISGTGTPTRGPAAIALTTAADTGVLFFIGNDEIFLTTTGDTRGDEAELDTNVAHTYRVTVTGTGAVSVSVDGTPTLTGSTYVDEAAFGATRRVLWGEGSKDAFGTHAWAFVRHNGSQCVGGTTTTLPGGTTTTTTLPGGTTTTTLIGGTTTTTTVGGSTTTTTLPTCAGAPGTIENVQCLLDALITRVSAEDLGKLQAKLLKTLNKANTRLAAATAACAAGDARKADKQLKKVDKLLGKFARKLSSRSAQKQVEATLRESLITDGNAARAAVTELRGALDCQAAG